MIFEKIYFEELFPTGNFANQRYGMHIIIESSDEIPEAYRLAKEKVETAFRSLNPSPTPSITDYNTGQQGSYHLNGEKYTHPTHDGKPPVINHEAERVAILIENATSPDELSEYWLKAAQHGLKLIYENKLKELQ